MLRTFPASTTLLSAAATLWMLGMSLTSADNEFNSLSSRWCMRRILVACHSTEDNEQFLLMNALFCRDLRGAVLACEGMAARISACRPLLHGQVSISFSFHILSTDYLSRRAETDRFGHGVYATLDFSVAHSISARVQDEGCRFGSEGMAARISACRPRLHG